MKSKSLVVGMKVRANEGKFAGKIVSIVSLKGDKALIRSQGGGIDYVEKNTLDNETKIK